MICVVLSRSPTANPLTPHHQCSEPTALKTKGSRRWRPWTLLPQTWSFFSSPQEDKREGEINKVGERWGGRKKQHPRFSQCISLKKVCSGLNPKVIKLGTFQLALLGPSSPPQWDPALSLFQGSPLKQMVGRPSQKPEGNLTSSLSFTPITNEPLTQTCRFSFSVSLESSPEPSTTLPCLALEQFLEVSRPRSFHSQHDVAMISLKGRSAYSSLPITTEAKSNPNMAYQASNMWWGSCLFHGPFVSQTLGVTPPHPHKHTQAALLSTLHSPATQNSSSSTKGPCFLLSLAWGVCLQWMVYGVCPQWMLYGICPQWMVYGVCPQWLVYGVCLQWMVASNEAWLLVFTPCIVPSPGTGLYLWLAFFKKKKVQNLLVMVWDLRRPGSFCFCDPNYHGKGPAILLKKQYERPHEEATWKMRGPDISWRRKAHLSSAPANLPSKCSPHLTISNNSRTAAQWSPARLQNCKQWNDWHFKPLSFGEVCYIPRYNCNKLNL